MRVTFTLRPIREAIPRCIVCGKMGAELELYARRRPLGLAIHTKCRGERNPVEDLSKQWFGLWWIERRATPEETRGRARGHTYFIGICNPGICDYRAVLSASKLRPGHTESCISCARKQALKKNRPLLAGGMR